MEAFSPPFKTDPFPLAALLLVTAAVELLPSAGIGCFPAGAFPTGVPLEVMSSSNLLRLTSGRSNHGAFPLVETLKFLGTMGSS